MPPPTSCATTGTRSRASSPRPSNAGTRGDDREARAAGGARPAVHPHQRHGRRGARGARDLHGRDRRSHPRLTGRGVVGRTGGQTGRMHERAGTQATESDLIDVEALVRAYYEQKPDASVPEQRVVFGTSGHRGSSLNTSVQRAPHPRHDPGDRRVPRVARHHRAALHRRRHARAERSRADHRPRRARRQPGAGAHRRVRRLRADARPVARDPEMEQRPRDPRRGRGRRHRDHPVAQPAPRRRLQVQPAARRPGRLRGDHAGSRTAPTSSSRAGSPR